MLWTRRHVTAFSAAFTVVVIFLIAQLRSPDTVSNLIHNVGKPHTSALHLLIPASNPHLQLCRSVISSLMLGYPVPIINGYHLEDELDAAVSHLAKVRNIMRYLDDLPPSADDDLMLIIDGYDVVMTLPVEIMLKRYFEVVDSMNAKLEERFGPGSTQDVPGGKGEQPRQTILFGADKVCWPVDWNRPACWAVPSDTGIPKGAFGHEDGRIEHNQPLWLNSGTIIGPIGDMRLMMAATMERIRVDYDEQYEFRESDQKYMSDVWADQEYFRSVRELKYKGLVPVGGGEPVPKGGPAERHIPVLAPRQRSEYHIAMEYESALFQTRAGNDEFIARPTFSGPGYTTLVQTNYNRKANFQPYEITLPADVIASLVRLFKSIADLQELKSTPSEIIRHLQLGTNLVTKRVYALFHCTGGKDFLNDLWPTLWYYPYARSMLRAAIRETVKGRPLSPELIDGRIWTMAHTYPASTPRGDDVGIEAAGAWADVTDGWLSWKELCGEWEEEMFGGPNGEVVKPGKKEKEAKEAQKKKEAEEKKKKEAEDNKKAEEEKAKAEAEKKKKEEEEKNKPPETEEEKKKKEEALKKAEDERKAKEEEARKKDEEKTKDTKDGDKKEDANKKDAEKKDAEKKDADKTEPDVKNPMD